MISQQLIDALTATTFWPRLAKDPELQVAFQHNWLSVVYGGKDLIRHINLKEDQIHGSVLNNIIPIRPKSFLPPPSHAWSYADLNVDSQGGLVLSARPEYVDLGQADQDCINAYKESLRRTNSWGDLDEQGRAFAAEQANRIVARHFSLWSHGINPISYVILRGPESIATAVSLIHVTRLRSYRGGYSDPFALQLKVITERREPILKELNDILDARQKLGAAHNLANHTDPITLLSERPVCAVGDCTEADIEQIHDQSGPWKWIAESGIEEHCEIVPYWRTLQLT